MVLLLADEDELDGMPDAVDEEFDRTS
jgi:hypothetical protein